MFPHRQVTLLLWHTGWRLQHTEKPTHWGEQLQLGHSSDTKHVFLYSRPSLSSQEPKMNQKVPCKKPGRRALQAALLTLHRCTVFSTAFGKLDPEKQLWSWS